ncbi:MAG: low molecular weight phosphotyrosine protein phosphatase [Schwartzia sp.]|nr:low molecular weight phosphotyrosine protein phosphatase [Schwartzia sp. (in: firmicutes)]
MIKIMFVCHGNICRSPMAEFVMEDLVRRAGLEGEVLVASAATTTEAVGGDVHPGTKDVLRKQGIPFGRRRARQMTREDYAVYDWIVAMDEENLRDLSRMTGGDPDGKVRLLMSFAGEGRGVADPWYTGNFDATFRDVQRGCGAILDRLARKTGGHGGDGQERNG